MTFPEPKGGYELRETGGNVLLTVRAPRDGAGRKTSASDLSIRFNPEQFDEFASRCVFINAGLKR